jgi:hypothetical protein
MPQVARDRRRPGLHVTCPSPYHHPQASFPVGERVNPKERQAWDGIMRYPTMLTPWCPGDHPRRSGSLPMVEVEHAAEPRPAGDLDESTAIGPAAVHVDRGAGGRLLVELLISAEAGLRAVVRARPLRARPRPRGRRFRRDAHPRRRCEIRTGQEGGTKGGEEVGEEGEHGKVAHDANSRVRTLFIRSLTDGKLGMRMKSWRGTIINHYLHPSVAVHST